MTPFVLFPGFVGELGRGKHRLAADTFHVLLCADKPKGAYRAEVTEIDAENGYPAGGLEMLTDYSESPDKSLWIGHSVVFVARGGGFGPFRYAVVYNASQAAGPLVGSADFGADISCEDGDEFEVRASTLLEMFVE